MCIIQTFIFILLMKDMQTIQLCFSAETEENQAIFFWLHDWSEVKALHVRILLHFSESTDIFSETVLLCTSKFFFSVVF